MSAAFRPRDGPCLLLHFSFLSPAGPLASPSCQALYSRLGAGSVPTRLETRTPASRSWRDLRCSVPGELERWPREVARAGQVLGYRVPLRKPPDFLHTPAQPGQVCDQRLIPSLGLEPSERHSPFINCPGPAPAIANEVLPPGRGWRSDPMSPPGATLSLQGMRPAQGRGKGGGCHLGVSCDVSGSVLCMLCLPDPQARQKTRPSNELEVVSPRL